MPNLKKYPDGGTTDTIAPVKLRKRNTDFLPMPSYKKNVTRAQIDSLYKSRGLETPDMYKKRMKMGGSVGKKKC